MIGILYNRTFRLLLSAQIVALLGTGFLTIALGLLAFDLAGENAGSVLGTALAIKMVAYVGLAPFANAIAETLPRKSLLVCADLVRALVALSLPFIDTIWQIYVLIFVLQAASAAFTPAFQAIIPDVLIDEDEYTKALSLSRLAYEMENLLSPLLAGLLLLFVGFHWLFVGTFVGFVLSALLVVSATLPPRQRTEAKRSFADRLTRGARIFVNTPRLRGLLGLNLAAAAISAFVLVNTVVIVRSGYGGPEAYVAYALAGFGAGSMVAALTLPKLLHVLSDRYVMITSAFGLCFVAIFHAAWLALAGLLPWIIYLVLWFVKGAFFSGILTPTGRLLRRSAHAEDRPAVFAAQFAFSHACWLITYPIAGWGGRTIGMPETLAVLASIGFVGVFAAQRYWPKNDPEVIAHEHSDLPTNHPHLTDSENSHGKHAHAFVIDDVHTSWPT